MSVDLEKLYVRNIELNDERELSIYQSEVGDVGCVVWDAALVLAKYLETEDFNRGKDLKGKSVVELGAGTGAVGIITSALGANAIVTDLPEFVPLMSHNVEANASKVKGSCVAMALTWGSEEEIKAVTCRQCGSDREGEREGDGGIDYIVVADCVYYDESIDPLITTIKALSSATTTVLCCYEDRELGNKTEMQNKFFQMAASDYTLTKVPTSKQDPVYSSEDIHIYRMTLKPPNDQ